MQPVHQDRPDALAIDRGRQLSCELCAIHVENQSCVIRIVQALPYTHAKNRQIRLHQARGNPLLRRQHLCEGSGPWLRWGLGRCGIRSQHHSRNTSDICRNRSLGSRFDVEGNCALASAVFAGCEARAQDAIGRIQQLLRLWQRDFHPIPF